MRGVRAYARGMRKIGTVAATLLLAASLSGCGALPVSRSASTPTPTVDPRAQAADAFTQESAYLTALRNQLTTTDFSSPQLWIDLGRAVCKGFDDGLTPKNMFDYLKDAGLSEPEASAVVVISGIHLCPEYAPTP